MVEHAPWRSPKTLRFRRVRLASSRSGKPDRIRVYEFESVDGLVRYAWATRYSFNSAFAQHLTPGEILDVSAAWGRIPFSLLGPRGPFSDQVLQGCTSILYPYPIKEVL